MVDGVLEPHVYRLGGDRTALRRWRVTDRRPDRGLRTLPESVHARLLQARARRDPQVLAWGADHHEYDGHLSTPGLSCLGTRNRRHLLGLLSMAECRPR